jgi:hypothetical protein
MLAGAGTTRETYEAVVLLTATPYPAPEATP